MRVLPCLVSLMTLCVLIPAPPVSAALQPPERSYNILMLLPVATKSHFNVFKPLIEKLTERGHKVTILCSHDPAHSKENKKITHINHGLTHFNEGDKNRFNMGYTPYGFISKFSKLLPLMARELYEIKEVQELYKRRDDFDLFVIDNLFNELAFPFVHDKSYITLAPGGLEPRTSSVIGNTQNPAYVSSQFTEFPVPLTFMDRIKNIFINIAMPFLWNHVAVIPNIQAQVDKHFPGLPSLLEIERNQSLVLLNSHFSYSTSLPLVPGQIEVGGMHCTPGKPLPEDLQRFVSGNTPVVYFSLGSVAKGNTMPQKYKDIFISAFSKLPFKVLWKFEEDIKNLPKNVMIKSWMPQQDVLADPNVKVFISHCGLLSVQEAVYHGTPILGMPIFGDQPSNALRLESKGISKKIDWPELTEELLIATMNELITNPSYINKVKEIQATFTDLLQPPVELAVYWTEYVIRHSGAVHLRSPERDLSWVQFLHLDILLLLHLIVFLVVWTTKRLFRLCFGSKAVKKVNKKKKE